MPHFRFIGDPNQRNAKWKEDHPGYQANDPASITFFAAGNNPGIKFVLNGEAVEVSDGDRAARLRGNSHFEEVGVEQLGSGNGHSAGGDGGFPGTQSADLDS